MIMCLSPKKPKITPPPPPPDEDAARANAEEDAAERRRRRRGTSFTNLTSGLGVTNFGQTSTPAATVLGVPNGSR